MSYIEKGLTDGGIITSEGLIIMEAICSFPIFLSLTLLAIVIAVFVFASSFYKISLEASAKEQEDFLPKRRELIDRKRKELVQKIGEAKDDALSKELRAELDKMDNELKNIEQSVVKAKNKAKALTVTNLVIIPGAFLVASIITSGVATATSGSLTISMFSISIILIAIGSYFILKNLFMIEDFSKTTDLSTLMEQALDRHVMKRQPIVDMDVWDFQLAIVRGKTEEIEYNAFLKQGTIGKNAKVQFLATKELVFPEEKVKPFGLEKSGRMKKPNYFVHEVGTMKWTPSLGQDRGYVKSGPRCPHGIRC
jgi:hypothetical protein